MRIAITGHRELPPTTERLVDQAIREQLAAYRGPDLVGVSCLADGSDQIFARAVLDTGGQIDVIVPRRLSTGPGYQNPHTTYDSPLAKASHIDRLGPHRIGRGRPHGSRNAMLSRVRHRLFAVWDGKPAGIRRHSRCRR
jgi:hypothetical protein